METDIQVLSVNNGYTVISTRPNAQPRSSTWVCTTRQDVLDAVGEALDYKEVEAKDPQ